MHPDAELEKIIDKLPTLSQSQYGVILQLKALSQIAIKLGLYDADDFIKEKIK